MEYTDLEDDEDFSNLDRGNNFEGTEDEEDLEDTEDEEENEDQEDEQEDSEEIEEIEEEVEPPKKEPKIPKSRLDQALRRAQKSEERALWLEEQLEKLIDQNNKQTPSKIPDTPPYDFEAAEEQYATFLIEGETTKAAKLRREIENERQNELKALISQIKESAVEEATTKTSAATENAKFKTLIKNYENKYTFLDAEHDEYNEEAIDTVNTLMTGYVAKGLTKSEALTKAVKKVAPMYEKEVKSSKKSISQERKVEAGKKAVEASKSQPSKTKSSTSTTIDTSKLNVSKMSEKDFAKLTSRELKLLRGD